MYFQYALSRDYSNELLIAINGFKDSNPLSWAIVLARQCVYITMHILVYLGVPSITFLPRSHYVSLTGWLRFRQRRREYSLENARQT